MNNRLIITPATGSSRVNVGDKERIASVLLGYLIFKSGLKNLPRLTYGSFIKTAVGGMLLFRGATGYCHVNQAVGRTTVNKSLKPLKLQDTMTVNRPRADVYKFWRKLENLPLFMLHLNKVTEYDQKTSHWEAKVPGGLGTLKWDAEIIEEQENTLISWRSVKGSVVDNAGHVIFKDAPGDRGTEIHATISYHPPAGDLGATVSRLFNNLFEQMIREDLRRFKRMMETGELPTITGQPAARKREDLPVTL